MPNDQLDTEQPMATKDQGYCYLCKDTFTEPIADHMVQHQGKPLLVKKITVDEIVASLKKLETVSDQDDWIMTVDDIIQDLHSLRANGASKKRVPKGTR